MAIFSKNEGGSLHEQLRRLEREGQIPILCRGIILQKRWQWRAYLSGVYYATPTKPEQMGRYNDPSATTGVCYTADSAAIAIAESLGRNYQQDPESFIISVSDLVRAQIYTLETTRETTTIDMTRLQAMLHITADKTMGDSHHMTQSITDWAANHSKGGYDGITYRSRHYLNVGTCSAFWQRTGKGGPLIALTHSSVDDYFDSDKRNYPMFWLQDDITGFEIVTRTLGFTVSAEEIT